MKNPEHAKHFEDVDLDGMGFGGLSGAAIQNHNTVKSKPKQEGVELRLECDHCGSPQRMLLAWNEVIVISAGAIPPGWKYDQGHIRPDIGCASCRHLVSPGVTPSEAQRWVSAGINARFVDPNHANALVAKAKNGAVRR